MVKLWSLTLNCTFFSHGKQLETLIPIECSHSLPTWLFGPTFQSLFIEMDVHIYYQNCLLLEKFGYWRVPGEITNSVFKKSTLNTHINRISKDLATLGSHLWWTHRCAGFLDHLRLWYLFVMQANQTEVHSCRVVKSLDSKTLPSPNASNEPYPFLI